MTAPRSGPPSNTVDTDVAQGDRLARLGEWSGALAAWQTALDGPEAARASKRIRWFLAETDDHTIGPTPEPNRRKAYRVLLAAMIAASLGTAVTVIGSGRSGTGGTLVAIAAWVSFAVTIGLTILFARLLAAPFDPQQPLSRDRDARAIAEAMTRARAVEGMKTSGEKDSPVVAASGLSQPSVFD